MHSENGKVNNTSVTLLFKIAKSCCAIHVGRIMPRQ